MPHLSENITAADIVFFNVYGLHLRWTKQSSFSYMQSPRPNHGFMYILCDKIEVEYKNGEKESFFKNNLIYIPEGLYYSVRFFGESESLDALLINFSVLGELPRCNGIKRLVSSADSSYSDRFYKIVSLYTNTKNHKYGIMEQFYALLVRLSSHLENKTISSPLHKSILPAVNYINSHVNEQIYIPELAKKCLLSESAFRKRFLESFKKSPAEYISGLKLEKAAELLKNTDVPICRIVSELGFYDSAYFYKLFKKKFGTTPSVYRESAN